MTIYLDVERGFSFWPVIVIPKKHRGTVLEKPQVAHESDHYNRQGWLVLWWIFRYFTSRKFRMQEETRAYKAQIAEYAKILPGREDEYTILKANSMATLYRGMCTFDEAIEALNR